MDNCTDAGAVSPAVRAGRDGQDQLALLLPIEAARKGDIAAGRVQDARLALQNFRMQPMAGRLSKPK